jgi:predicted O-methyltransferase YrrM
MLNITPEAGRFLAILVRAMGARRILEIGTSNGYSTLWLAWAAEATDGRVITIERAADKAMMARENFVRAGLVHRIEQREGAALDVLGELDGPFDLIFLDADRPGYVSYFERIIALPRPGGLLITDNAVSHAHELTDFFALLRAHPDLESVTLPVGNGEELTYRRA